MMQILLAVEIIVAICLVAVILLQRSEGGALGMGGGGGIGGLMSARGAGNLLTRATAVLAFTFIALSLALAALAGNRGDGTSVFDQPDRSTPVSEEEQSPVDSDLPSLDDFLLDDPDSEDQPLADPDQDQPLDDPGE